MNPLPTIAKPLIQAGLITEKDVRRIEESLLYEEGFLSGLIRAKIVDDLQIAETLAQHYRTPHLRLSTIAISPGALKYADKAFALQYHCIPVRLDEETQRLILAQEDPLDFRPKELIEARHNILIKCVLASHSSIEDAIRQYYGREESLESIIKGIDDPEDLEFLDPTKIKKKSGEIVDLSETESQPVVKLVNHIIIDSIRARASDIHMEPTVSCMQVRYRIDGVLIDAFSIPKWLQNPVTSRIKILAEVDISERRKPQDGRIDVKYRDRSVDLRVSTLPTHLGEKIVMRILDHQATSTTLEDLGFSTEDMAKLHECIKKPQGLLLTTGPTGSGKSTTLYACLTHVKSPKINIITIENPIEYHMTGVNQVQINDRAGLTFATTLRSVLRQDPNVIMVGEIRDRETAEIAVQAAMTGHLVLSSLHTNDSVATISRLFDLGVDAALLASSLIAILAQRLVRRICKDCVESYKPDPEALRMMGLDRSEQLFLHGAGCEKCKMTGFAGRVGIYELLVVDARLRAAIGRHDSEQDLRKMAVSGGMVAMLKQASEKVLAGITTVEEVTRVIQTEVAFQNQCPACQRDLDPQFSACPYCGETVKGLCAACHQEIKTEWKVCPHCRTAITNGKSPDVTATDQGGTTVMHTPLPKVSAVSFDPPSVARASFRTNSIAEGSGTGLTKILTSSAPPANASQQLTGVEKLKVMVVDDDPLMRRFVGLFIRRIQDNVEIFEAKDGLQALAKVESASPHMIVLDIQMPGMDGFEVCQKLREDIRTAFIPVLMMTASPKSETRAQAFAVGTDDFISKPIVPAQLEEKIKRLLHRTYGF